MQVDIRAVAWSDPDGVALRAAQRVELEERYGRPDSETGPAPTEHDMPVFLVAYDGGTGEPLVCGGLRDLGPGVAEVKRMYAVPAVRGTGVATTVLRALERQARSRGVVTLRLETGNRQPDAIRFYEREGYRRTPLFGHYVGSTVSVCFERDLTG